MQAAAVKRGFSVGRNPWNEDGIRFPVLRRWCVMTRRLE